MLTIKTFRRYGSPGHQPSYHKLKLEFSYYTLALLQLLKDLKPRQLASTFTTGSNKVESAKICALT